MFHADHYALQTICTKGKAILNQYVNHGRRDPEKCRVQPRLCEVRNSPMHISLTNVNVFCDPSFSFFENCVQVWSKHSKVSRSDACKITSDMWTHIWIVSRLCVCVCRLFSAWPLISLICSTHLSVVSLCSTTACHFIPGGGGTVGACDTARRVSTAPL